MCSSLCKWINLVICLIFLSVGATFIVLGTMTIGQYDRGFVGMVNGTITSVTTSADKRKTVVGYAYSANNASYTGVSTLDNVYSMLNSMSLTLCGKVIVSYNDVQPYCSRLIGTSWVAQTVANRTNATCDLPSEPEGDTMSCNQWTEVFIIGTGMLIIGFLCIMCWIYSYLWDDAEQSPHDNRVHASPV